LIDLKSEFQTWESLISSMTYEQRASFKLANGWTLKDLLAHLLSWQQVSIARFEAALSQTEPAFPNWLDGSDPESESELKTFNSRIYDAYLHRVWSEVFELWRKGFLELLGLAEKLGESILLDKQTFKWLRGYALYDVLEGTLEHHREHREVWPKSS
jgi:hypothetical protein